MTLIELFLIAIGLSMDAFAVSICTGLSTPRVNIWSALVVGLYFGFFQAAMPLAGYFTGIQFARHIRAFDHWIAFVLLSFIGFRMIWGSIKTEVPSRESGAPLSPGRMLPLALATSIDALAVGVSFAFLDVKIVPAVSFIGLVTLTFSMAGVKIGNAFGIKFKSKAEFLGGLILILMGIKILLEHTGILRL